MRQEAVPLYARAMQKAALPLALLLLAGCEGAPSGPRVSIEDAVLVLPAVPGRPGAAYFTLRTNAERTRLTGVTSPRIGRIELHETVSEDGVSRMVALRDPAFSTGEPLSFAPGGRHAMAFDVDPALRPGDRVALTFSFDPAPAVTVEAEVRAPGDRAAH